MKRVRSSESLFERVDALYAKKSRGNAYKLSEFMELYNAGYLLLQNEEDISKRRRLQNDVCRRLCSLTQTRLTAPLRCSLAYFDAPFRAALFWRYLLLTGRLGLTRDLAWVVLDLCYPPEERAPVAARLKSTCRALVAACAYVFRMPRASVDVDQIIAAASSGAPWSDPFH